MLGDNIKKYRKEKGYTQEELSGMLHVVRQTLSKWENNVSVPDAEVLVRISEALDVPVSILLDLTQEQPTMDLAGELARLKEELAQRNGQLQRNALAGKKRGQMIVLSFVALMVMIGVHDPVVSLVLVGACFGLALLILYRNLPKYFCANVTIMHMKLWFTNIFATQLQDKWTQIRIRTAHSVHFTAKWVCSRRRHVYMKPVCQFPLRCGSKPPMSNRITCTRAGS